MAHEIYIENGRASMMYVGGEPWHGLGQKLDKPKLERALVVIATWGFSVLLVHLILKSNGL